MYTIRQASARSGVGVSLLRAWERRYGVVAPTRTPSGYRLYDDEAITRLRSMRQLVDGGWSASQAADAVINGQIELTGMREADPPSGLADVESFLAAAAGYDAVALDAALDAMFSRGSYEAVIDELVLPAVAALGSAWESGRIDVAAEHLASETVQRRLASLFDLGGAVRAGRAAAVGLPPGARHEIGTLAFAVALRRQGINVLYLGPDVPRASWVHIATGRTLAAVVIGVPVSSDVDDADEVAVAIRDVRPGLFIGAGGPYAQNMIADVRILADRVSRAAVEVAALIGSR